MAEAIFEVFRGNREGGLAATYRVPIVPGMVVLDALHHIQAHQAPDLAIRWRRSMAARGSPAKPAWTHCPWTSPSQFSR
jgi:succinate dehydrogenase / fumarate reductase iron-sulfur subunit